MGWWDWAPRRRAEMCALALAAVAVADGKLRLRARWVCHRWAAGARQRSGPGTWVLAPGGVQERWEEGKGKGQEQGQEEGRSWRVGAGGLRAERLGGRVCVEV